MTLPVGGRIGAYEILGFLGAGGMGEVYRARDAKLQRDVAIKILSGNVAADAERLKRFRREALSLAALSHPNIAHVYGLEEAVAAGDARVDALVMEVDALVMEYVDGETLADRARAALRWSAVAPLATQIVDALDASHSAGIVHRDLKPSNICVTTDGVVKVIDFGLAKPAPMNLADTATRSAVVDEGRVVGTVRYMSPEQARGGVVDKRTDIWAFGCVLFEVLSGKPAFAGATWTDTVVAIFERDPDWSLLPDHVPPGVVALIRHCLAKDPRQRLRDVADARVYLTRELEPGPPAPQRRAATVIPWILAAGLAIAMIGLAARSRGDSGPEPPQYGRATRLTSGGAMAMGPVVSPDGQWVAYMSNAGGATDLLVRYVAGGDTVNLTASSGLQLPTRLDLGGPTISPDGSMIAFDAGAKPGTPSNLFDAWVIPAPRQASRSTRPMPTEAAKRCWCRRGAACTCIGSNGRTMPRRSTLHIRRQPPTPSRRRYSKYSPREAT